MDRGAVYVFCSVFRILNTHTKYVTNKKMLLAQFWQRNNRFLHRNDFMDFRIERVSP